MNIPTAPSSFFFTALIATSPLLAQPKTDTLLHNILLRGNSQILKTIISQPDTFRLQIIYTQINRDANNVPSFKNYYFNFDSNLYFNPASTVKMPLAFLALEKIEQDRPGQCYEVYGRAVRQQPRRAGNSLPLLYLG